MDESVELPGQLQFFWDENPGKAPSKDSTASPAKKAVKARSGKKASGPTSASRSSAKVKTTAAAKTAKKKNTSKATESPVKKKTKAKKEAPKVAKKSSTKKKTTKKAAAKAAPKKTAKKKARKAPASKPAPAVTTPSVAKLDFAEKVESFDMKWGAQFPKVGLGFWKVDQEKTAEICSQAIKVGYRHLDCACDYGNEAEVGKGIAEAVKKGYCEREDLWVTSKLWNTYHSANHVQMACEKSLEDLGLDYLDLYLIHFPIAQRYVPIEKRYPPGWFFEPKASEPVIEEARIPLMETWQAMEELAKSGMVRNIGICNVGTSQLRDLLSYAKIRPAVLQVESHPYLTQDKLLRYCGEQGITYTAFSPFGAQSYFSLDMAKPSESVLEHKVVKEIAADVGKTPAQVLLRWGIQRGTSVIPKTSTPKRLTENIDIFDFSLSQKQMKSISSLDQGRRFNDPGDFGEAAFNTFLPIYE